MLFIFSILLSCGKEDIVLKSEGGFPDSPENLEFLNTPYDDYKSDLAPGVYDIYDFVFSSNRNSGGKDYDILLFSIGISYPFDEDVLSISESSGKTSNHFFLGEMLDILNSSGEELGPYIYFLPEDDEQPGGQEFILFYTSIPAGKSDIKYMMNESTLTNSGGYAYIQSGPFHANIINTETYNEAYLSISNNYLYFCSDRDGSYDIYRVKIDEGVSLSEFLSRPFSGVEKIENLNSSYQDKCPYVIDNFMVFTSNRPGGSGGYDLYFSRMTDDDWTDPQNFGSSINSESDDYRPVLRLYDDIPNDLMVFSSDRKGGLGGFDLYYAGIDETR
jgi:hypothetical protein